MSPQMSARTRQAETRHFQNGKDRQPGLHRVGDVSTELPEDSELEDLVDMEIPDLVTLTERSFDFVEAEMRAQRDLSQ